jgi:hypothetical protein
VSLAQKDALLAQLAQHKAAMEARLGLSGEHLTLGTCSSKPYMPVQFRGCVSGCCSAVLHFWFGSYTAVLPVILTGVQEAQMVTQRVWRRQLWQQGVAATTCRASSMSSWR